MGAHNQCSPAVGGAEASAEADVDYIALAALKSALRPKLRFVSGGGGSSPGLRRMFHECSATASCALAAIIAPSADVHADCLAPA